MEQSKSRRRYNELFPDDTTKARAFDKLAAAYYYTNFGQMQKADLETLMFSLYLDRILDENEEDMRSYSDYTLSKLLDWNLESPIGAFGIYRPERQFCHRYTFPFPADVPAEELAEEAYYLLGQCYAVVAQVFPDAVRISGHA